MSVDGNDAPLLFVSPNQINALLPFELQVTDPLGTKSVKITLTTAQGTSAPHSPGESRRTGSLYPGNDRKRPRHRTLTRLSTLDAVAPGDTVIVYAAGLGRTDPPAKSDSGGAAAEPFNRVITVPDVYIGDRKAAVLFAGLAPGFPGVYQLNLQVSAGASSDRAMLRAGQLQSNIAQVVIPAGQSVANVAGTITGLSPSDGSDPAYPVSYAYDAAVIPQVTRFSLTMDIQTTANAFTLLAAGKSGSALVQIDPVEGTWQRPIQALRAPARNGD